MNKQPSMNKALPKGAPSKATPKVAVTRAAKRVQDTKPRTAMPMPTSSDQTVSMRVEKIKNGHLVHTSKTDNKGNYSSETEYHEKPPAITVASVSVTPKGRKRG